MIIAPTNKACPDCGEPLHIAFAIDPYEVIARWLCGYGTAAGMPGYTSPAAVAEHLRNTLARNDPEYHDRLMAAATATVSYVGARILEQMSMMDDTEAGHA
jgi:ribosomal protein S27AE